MKTLYLDCSMGAAGDMLTAALLELLSDKDTRAAFVEKLNNIGLKDTKFVAEPSSKCDIKGTHMRVAVHGEEEHVHDHDHDHGHHHHDDEHTHSHHHHHRHYSLQDIVDLINSLDIADGVKADAIAVYTEIAEAEAYVHDSTVTDIHFHEVGSKDAVADVVAVCMLMKEIGAAQIVASPIHVGSGHVHCAHGVLPVPAPATAHILRGCPIYSGDIKGELCTPTGAALLKHYVTKFGHMPVMSVEEIGYGMGTKDFRIANCVRAMLGESYED